jgi:hypothetical protein
VIGAQAVGSIVLLLCNCGLLRFGFVNSWI